MSGLGKGITAASIGRLLKARGFKVANQKFDPYINVDPGTMSPFQHGEVFVTEDGAETDLDLGHYERFIDEFVERDSNNHHGGASTTPSSRRSAAATFSAARSRSSRTSPTRSRAACTGWPRSRRRRADHRGRRHGRRHREPAVPGSDPPVSQGHRARQRAVRPRHPGAGHRGGRRAQDQAYPAQRGRAARDRHPARHHRRPLRGTAQPRHPRQDRPLLRRRARGGHLGLRRRRHLQGAAAHARRGARRARGAQARSRGRRNRPAPNGARWSSASTPVTSRSPSRWSASTCSFTRPTCRSGRP